MKGIWIALPVVLMLGTAAVAADSDSGIPAACAADVQKLCTAASTDDAKQSCLEEKLDDASEACQNAYDGSGNDSAGADEDATDQ
jgi:hypothetical protein